MRICFLSSDFTPDGSAGQGGGIETYVRLISRGLAGRGHDVHVVVPTSKGSRRLVEGRVTLHAIRIPVDWQGEAPDLVESRAAMSFAWHAWRKVRALAAEDGPFDVIEAPEYKGQGAYIGRDRSMPLVVKCHAHLLFCLSLNRVPLTPDTALVAELEREALGSARAINSNSRFLASRCAGDYALDSRVLAHLPYGIDTHLFRPTSSQMRPRLGLGDRPTLLFAGRMEARKGLSTLVPAFAALARRRPDVVLLLAGSDVSGADRRSNAAWMCAEWERLGIASSRYLFLGRVPHEQMPAVYTAADVLVAPSPLEAFGFVYLESMACGCPPIACGAGGAPEIIEHERTGLLVEPNDVHALAGAMETLLDDRRRLDQLANRGRAVVAERFSVDAMLDRTEVFYREVAA